MTGTNLSSPKFIVLVYVALAIEHLEQNRGLLRVTVWNASDLLPMDVSLDQKLLTSTNGGRLKYHMSIVGLRLEDSKT